MGVTNKNVYAWSCLRYSFSFLKNHAKSCNNVHFKVIKIRTREFKLLSKDIEPLKNGAEMPFIDSAVLLIPRS